MTDDPHDSNWAESLLLRFSGTKGYETLVTAAVVADAMMAFQPAIRLEDAAAADFSLSAVEAAKLKQTLWALLYHGGIFLEECSETLTHTVLRSIRNKTVFLRAGTPKQSAMVLHWLYKVYEAYFDANFPMYEATSFSAFNLEDNGALDTSDRFRFIRMLCHRFNLEVNDVWRQMIGNGTTSGLLHRAIWHASPAGAAHAASVARPEGTAKPGKWCHAAETRSQRAWFATWSEIRTPSPAKDLVAIYLSALSGTGTVDRWLGQVRQVEKFRPHMDARGVEHAVKLLVQDQGGRRREPMKPKQVMVREHSKISAGGGGVAHPISDFGLRAQKVYLTLFGSRSLPARDLLPLTPAEVARKRLLAERPRLSKGRKGSGGGEAELLRLHQESLEAGAARILEGGGEAKGPLGPVDLPSPKRRRLMAEPAASVDNMYKAIKTDSKDLLSQVARDGEHESSVPAIQLQQKIMKVKADRFFHATPGQPVPYVDAIAGLMRPEKPLPASPGLPPELPARPRVWMMPDMPEMLKCNLDKALFAVRVSDQLKKSSDIVLVPDIRVDFEGPAALAARLVGARLVEPRWFECEAAEKNERQICFRSAVMCTNHVIMYLHSSFVDKHPQHAAFLRDSMALSPAMGNGRPRFQVTLGEMPESVSTPTLTYEIRAEDCPRPQPVALAENSRKTGKQWVLRDVLKFCTLVYDVQKGPTGA
ncbi:unnamed protein product [Symbiodinium microadriaticum]|nr:unnamed protein product [Symbiodinium microadriaticum]